MEQIVYEQNLSYFTTMAHDPVHCQNNGPGTHN